MDDVLLRIIISGFCEMEVGKIFFYATTYFDKGKLNYVFPVFALLIIAFLLAFFLEVEEGLN